MKVIMLDIFVRSMIKKDHIRRERQQKKAKRTHKNPQNEALMLMLMLMAHDYVMANKLA